VGGGVTTGTHKDTNTLQITEGASYRGLAKVERGCVTPDMINLYKHRRDKGGGAGQLLEHIRTHTRNTNRRSTMQRPCCSRA